MSIELSNEVLQVIRAFLQANYIQPRITLKELVQEIEKRAIIEALVITGGRKRNAARFLNILESTLCEKIKRLSIPDNPNGDEISWALPIPSYLVPEKKEDWRRESVSFKAS